MSADTAMQLLAQVLWASVKIAGPILLVTLVVGVAISVLQVVTQVQEMTLTFVPKMVAVGVVCLGLGSWMIATAVELARHLFDYAAHL
ncbi:MULTISPECIES: flagellar biosynthetic protein FliQ [Pseudoxanthomonas]|uniref:Flagellar biosynthetic protein FliQ n=1 Tax=Pseudoxanthomonas winnipegensis TaxID=2480810 RepID=A0AAW8GFY6_9GAMM|nr:MULTISPECIES: flagellar biosynthetic protein FliQ [Pseudoxanthomonas]MDQ1120682.1 flagellar biosynthetic protein FliQ [Pseudoxanthomonas winnipegensis]MDQ1133905.1 flagellar biosynthetic protein FliQ [Pseudoxanthomonas winnipegensis]MDR6139859.1 flagellar biosynthetic protein FliQ [Pseudoxanthomonas sp. SORGH_AS_0997]